MEITFDGHMHAQRQATITQNQLYRLFNAMKHDIMSHIEYSPLSEKDPLFPQDEAICDICKEHGVDFRYKKDRMAFFRAVFDSMENPYA